jgi:lipopolysaccharide exporter
VTSLGSKMAQGAAWMVAFKVADRGIGLISTVILARLLVPGDFGLMALATSMVALLALLGAFDLDTALIQKADAERRHFDTVWTFRVLFGIGIGLMLAVLASPAAQFYNDSRLVEVMYAFAATAVIGGFSNVGTVAFRKELQFDQEFKLLLVKRLATIVVTVPLAFAWRDYRALIAGVIAGSCLGVVASYVLHPYRPRVSLAAMGELFAFAKWILLGNLVIFIFSRAADFIVGRLAGPAALGLFTLAREVASLPTSELAAPIHRAVFPGYSKMAGTPGLLRHAYLQVTSLLMLIVLPAGVGLALLAEPVVLLFLGDRWTDAIVPLRVFALNGALMVFLSTAYYVHMAMGRPRLMTIVIAMHALVAIPLMLVLVPMLGTRGAALGLLAATVSCLPVNFYLLFRALGLRAIDMLRILWRPLVGTLVMFCAIQLVHARWSFAASFVGRSADISTSVAIGICVYAATIAMLWFLRRDADSAEAIVIARIRQWAEARGLCAKG